MSDWLEEGGRGVQGGGGGGEIRNQMISGCTTGEMAVFLTTGSPEGQD